MSNWYRIHGDDGVDLSSIAGSPSSVTWMPSLNEFFIAWQHLASGAVVLVAGNGLQYVDNTMPRGEIRTYVQHFDRPVQRLGIAFSSEYVDVHHSFQLGIPTFDRALLAVARVVANQFELPAEDLEQMGRPARRLQVEER